MPSTEAKIFEAIERIADVLDSINERLAVLEYRQMAAELGELTDEERAAGAAALRRKPARSAGELATERTAGFVEQAAKKAARAGARAAAKELRDQIAKVGERALNRSRTPIN